MPGDSGIYGFNKDDTIELLNLIGNSDVEFPEGPFRTGGSGGGGASLYAARMTENWTSRQATCEIYTLDGANDPVYVDDQEVYDPLSIFAALGADDWLKVGLNPDGKYYVVAANCPGTSPLIADPPATQP
jgi:hypothetical protein